VPRRINQLVNRLLLLGAVDHRPLIDHAMLADVLAEMAADGAMAARQSVDASVVSVASEPSVPSSSEIVSSGTGGHLPLDAEMLACFEQALAERDVQIAELQQAVIEMANAANAQALPSADIASPDIAALHARIADLEDRLTEQDHSIRHTLTMLIEWIEADDAQRVAA